MRVQMEMEGEERAVHWDPVGTYVATPRSSCFWYRAACKESNRNSIEHACQYLCSTEDCPW